MDHRGFAGPNGRHFTRRSVLKGIAGGSAAGVIGLRTRGTLAERRALSVLQSAGGVLNVAIPGDIRSLDPYGSNLAVWSLVRWNVYDTLFWIDPDTSELTPNLATEWSFEDDTTLAITVRDGITFHNGAAFSAEDVKFTLDYVADPNNPTGEFQNRLRSIASTEVVDATHLRIHLNQPDASLPFILSAFYILSRGDTDIVAGPPNGTGAFKFVEWQQNNQITLERNPSYWVEGRPLLDQVVLKVIPEAETRIASLVSGQVDFIFELGLQDVPRVQDESGLAVAIAPPANGFWHAYVNMRRPPFDNVNVRKAVLHAFDRVSYVEAFAAGLAKPTNSPLNENHWAYNPAVTDLYPYDLELAAQLLEEAGYPGGAGLEFTFIYPPGYPDFRNGSILIQSAMTELGAKVNVQELELATWSSKIVQEFDFDIAWDIGGGGAGDPGPVFGASPYLTPSETNFNGLTEEMAPEYAQLIKDGVATTDQEARIQIYHQLQAMLAENVYDLMFAHRSIAYGVADRVQGFEARGHGRVKFDEVSVD